MDSSTHAPDARGPALAQPWSAVTLWGLHPATGRFSGSPLLGSQVQAVLPGGREEEARAQPVTATSSGPTPVLDGWGGDHTWPLPLRVALDHLDLQRVLECPCAPSVWRAAELGAQEPHPGSLPRPCPPGLPFPVARGCAWCHSSTLEGPWDGAPGVPGLGLGSWRSPALCPALALPAGLRGPCPLRDWLSQGLYHSPCFPVCTEFPGGTSSAGAVHAGPWPPGVASCGVRKPRAPLPFLLLEFGEMSRVLTAWSPGCGEWSPDRKALNYSALFTRGTVPQPLSAFANALREKAKQMTPAAVMSEAVSEG